MPRSVANARRLADGATAEVYAWGEGSVLKLFHEHIPMHAIEVAATRSAYEASLPVPAVLSGLIEVDQRKGIVFERLQGPTLAEHLRRQSIAESALTAVDYARQMAELRAQIHSTEVSDLLPLAEILHGSIREATTLAQASRQAVLSLLHGLPDGNALCHNDFYPNNLIASPTSLSWDGPQTGTEDRVSLVQAVLSGEAHPWSSTQKLHTETANARARGQNQ